MLDVKKTIAKLLKSAPQKVTFSGTTTSTGALAIPTQYRGKTLAGLYCTNLVSLVYRRDDNYLTVMWQGGSGDTLIPRANTSVTISAYIMGG